VINTIENSLVSRLGEARLLSGLLVALITVTETLGTEVEGIAERLVDACEVVTAGHEDLGRVSHLVGTTIHHPMIVDALENK
jgi:hypothetical protein